MHFVKKISILALGAFVTYASCNYFLKDEKNVTAYDETTISDNELAAIPKGAIKQNRTTASVTTDTTGPDFFKNTYDVVPDPTGQPKYKLKHGKRYYNAELMEEISSSANIEQVRAGDE